MNSLTWLKNNADLVMSDIPDDSGRVWITKSRGDYITREGMEDKVAFLIEYEIDMYVSSSKEAGCPINIGFSSSQGRWYGWSHRAINYFEIGSTCIKSDTHYKSVNKEEFIERMVKFWEDPSRTNIVGTPDIAGVNVTWDYATKGVITSGGCYHLYPDKWGRGEWTAETLADARQMAIDFAESVS